ncbi:MAG: Rho termination factor N-terminal domain-containing protein [Gaiellales bacterium]
MATTRQLQAARDNLEQLRRVQTAIQGGDRKVLQGTTIRSLENRNRQQLYALARTCGISGGSAMGKDELIDAIRRSR